MIFRQETVIKHNLILQVSVHVYLKKLNIIVMPKKTIKKITCSFKFMVMLQLFSIT